MANIQRQKNEARELIERLDSVIAAELGPRWGKDGVLKHGEGLRYEDKSLILILMSLRESDKNIMSMVNTQRKEAGLDDACNLKILYYYRRKYAALIDEIYAITAIRIGEIYSFADKLVRIARLNEMADALHARVIPELTSKIGGPDDFTIKMGKLLVTVMDKINGEMGGKTLLEGFRPHIDKANEEEEKDIPLDAQDLTEIIDQRYGAQLPERITRKIEFSDYFQCAQGEKMGEVYVCWNHKMTNNNVGAQCAVQLGEMNVCPKFLNKSLLNNRDWLLDMRKRGLTIVDIAHAVGCKKVDKDSHDRVTYYLKSQDIIMRKPNEKDYQLDERDAQYEEMNDTTDEPETGEET